MPVTELNTAWVTPYDPRRRAAERRPPREPFARAQTESPVVHPAPDPTLLTPMFRPDLSQISAAVGPPAPAQCDTALAQLVSAVREGDLARARAAFEALETEMLVERSVASDDPSPGRDRPAPEPFATVAASAHAADDAYETLSHYLDADGPV